MITLCEEFVLCEGSVCAFGLHVFIIWMMAGSIESIDADET
jgi:hypothetical protein